MRTLLRPGYEWRVNVMELYRDRLCSDDEGLGLLSA